MEICFRCEFKDGFIKESVFSLNGSSNISKISHVNFEKMSIHRAFVSEFLFTMVTLERPFFSVSVNFYMFLQIAFESEFLFT